MFNFENHNVRTVVDENGEILFVANDVALALGYANARKAVSDHCKEKGVTKRYTLSKGGNQQVIFINPNAFSCEIKITCG